MVSCKQPGALESARAGIDVIADVVSNSTALRQAQRHCAAPFRLWRVDADLRVEVLA